MGDTASVKTSSLAVPGELQGAHEIALNAAPSGVLVCDEDGQILFANAKIGTILGYAPEALVGVTVGQVFPQRSKGTHPAEQGGFWAEASSMGAGREVFGRRKDGSEVPVEIGLTATEQDGRRLVIASVVDLSERRQLQQDLQRALSERLAFEHLVAQIAARFVSVPPEDVDTSIVDCQRQIVEALGIDRSALWQFDDGETDLYYTHVWSRPEFSPPPPLTSAVGDFPWIVSRILAQEAAWISRVDDLAAPIDRESLRSSGNKAMAVVPLTHAGRVMGALSFGAMRAEKEWSPDVQERLRLLAAVFAQALDRRRTFDQLQSALAEVERLRDRLALENVQLQNEVKTLKGPRSIAAESTAIRLVMTKIESVANTNATVLLLGETGCGKEVFAQALHDASDRRHRPMVRVNCGAIPTALIESELFGRERGAYTGALSRQIGRFELANGSTIFLDEVGDLPLDAQVKLLRVLQDKVVERLGSVRPIKVDVRIIAATNRNLAKAVADRTFREDLYYRLNVFPIVVPPLRERLEDIPVLVWTFIEEFSKGFNKKIESISRESLAALQAYSWPGNVRELRNVIERAVIVARGPRLTVEPPRSEPAAVKESVALSDVEAEHIRSVLIEVGWRVRGPGGAAELLGMKPTTLESRMAKLDIRRPHRQSSE